MSGASVYDHFAVLEDSPSTLGEEGEEDAGLYKDREEEEIEWEWRETEGEG